MRLRQMLAARQDVVTATTQASTASEESLRAFPLRD
jgi:hypothetical protein